MMFNIAWKFTWLSQHTTGSFDSLASVVQAILPISVTYSLVNTTFSAMHIGLIFSWYMVCGGESLRIKLWSTSYILMRRTLFVFVLPCIFFNNDRYWCFHLFKGVPSMIVVLMISMLKLFRSLSFFVIEYKMWCIISNMSWRWRGGCVFSPFLNPYFIALIEMTDDTGDYNNPDYFYFVKVWYLKCL